MLKRTMVLAAFIAASMISYGAAATEKYTGCVTWIGAIIKLAPGDEPLRPCRFGQTEITLHTNGNDNNAGGEVAIVLASNALPTRIMPSSVSPPPMATLPPALLAPS